MPKIDRISLLSHNIRCMKEIICEELNLLVNHQTLHSILSSFRHDFGIFINYQQHFIILFGHCLVFSHTNGKAVHRLQNQNIHKKATTLVNKSLREATSQNRSSSAAGKVMERI